jgi:hypothetical protein
VERVQSKKNWERYLDDDDLDLEGERILSEIRNYKAEFLRY